MTVKCGVTLGPHCGAGLATRRVIAFVSYRVVCHDMETRCSAGSRGVYGSGLGVASKRG